MEFIMESSVEAPLDWMGETSADKSPIIEQDVFRQDELQALFEVAKQKTSPGGNNSGL
jgi:hypothetical protein